MKRIEFNSLKKIVCIVLALMMVASLAIMPVSADDVDEHTHTPNQLGVCTGCGLNIMGLLNQAYIYSFPLVLMDVTKEKTTNTETATYTQAPVNQFVHVPAFADANAKDIVLPNVDTLYSQAFLDLEESPVIMEMPKTNRYCIMQLMDAFSNTVEIVECMYQEGRTTYIITGPGFAGEIPDGMVEIKCPTNMAWILGRTVCADNENNALDNWIVTRTIQYQMKMYTLEQYKNGTQDTPAKGEVEEEYKDIVPLNYVIYNLSAKQYFERANKLLEKNPPKEADAQMIAAISAVGVGAGLEFDYESLGGEAAVTLMYGWIRQNLVSNCTAGSLQYYKANGCWNYAGTPIGDYGTAYIYRCLIALGGFGANPPEMAIYPNATTDVNGAELTGEKSYTIHLTPEQIALLNKNDGFGFWSITAYGKDQYLIANEENRYCINDRNAVFNKDGSIDIYVSNKAPADREKYPNWLPVGTEGFSLYFRIYLPCGEILANDWTMPAIEVYKEQGGASETGDSAIVHIAMVLVAAMGLCVVALKNRKIKI